MKTARQKAMSSTFEKLYSAGDELSRLLAKPLIAKSAQKTVRKKPIMAATLDEKDIDTVKWLIDSLGWLPAKNRDALERLAKKVGY